MALIAPPAAGETGAAVRGWDGPYLDSDSVPADPWGLPYGYAFPPMRGRGPGPDIWSFGPDNMDGTEDDIVSWNVASTGTGETMPGQEGQGQLGPDGMPLDQGMPPLDGAMQPGMQPGGMQPGHAAGHATGRNAARNATGYAARRDATGRNAADGPGHAAAGRRDRSHGRSHGRRRADGRNRPDGRQPRPHASRHGTAAAAEFLSRIISRRGLTEGRHLPGALRCFERACPMVARPSSLSRACPGPRPAPRGFTLVEMLVVLAIVALLSAMTWPSVQRLMNRARVKDAARQVRTELGEARLRAIESGKPQVFRFQPGTGAFEIRPKEEETAGPAVLKSALEQMSDESVDTEPITGAEIVDPAAYEKVLPDGILFAGQEVAREPAGRRRRYGAGRPEHRRDERAAGLVRTDRLLPERPHLQRADPRDRRRAVRRRREPARRDGHGARRRYEPDRAGRQARIPCRNR